MSGFAFELLTEAELSVLEKIAKGVYGSIDGSIVSAGGWNSSSVDWSGTFCSRSCPGTPFRRLIDMGLVIEYRQESKRIFGWKWAITNDGRALLDRMNNGSTSMEEAV